MYKNKKDVDKHVENLLSKLTPKEFKTRAFSVARLYFEVGDYSNCQKYVEQYLTQKDNNAAAFKLLGQALQKLGQKEKALEHFSTSLDIDPAQTSTILDVCELLADNDVVIEPGIGKFWCERAEAAFPRHPIIFRLQERLATVTNTDPEALTKLLTAELEARPKDAQLHVRLLKHYLHNNKVKEAFEHSCNIEFGGNTFLNYYAWYETLVEILKYQHNGNDWLFQLFILTIREKICMLSLTETPSGTSKSLVESCELLHAYDQAIESVAKLGPPSSFGEFHGSLVQHHRGQFALHAATYLLKKAKKNQLGWRDAVKLAAPLMLTAWHTVPLDPKVNWLKHSPEKQTNAVIRWYSEGTYRCSQAGHYLIQCTQDRSQTFLDQISQYCSVTHWKAKLYENIFTRQEQLMKIKSSHFASNDFATPPLRLPRRIEVEAYDADAQKQYGNSLHHFVWMLMNYKNYAQFKCTLFDMLKPIKNKGGLETLNKLDVYAFLFCACLTAQQQKSRKDVYISSEKPNLLPASITDLLCSLTQMKWWDCVYKFSQNTLGTELTDIRSTLSRGMEVVRCVDNHGLDPELLCILGQIFDKIAQSTTNIDEKTHVEMRAHLYYSSAIPILEKLKSKMSIQIPEIRMFDYTHKELGPKELNTLIEESKLYVAVRYFNECEYDKVIEILSNLTSPKAYYYIAQTYKNIALEENNVSKDATPDTNLKYASLMMKAKNYAYKALNKLKETETSQMQPLYVDTQELIENIQTYLNKMDVEFSDALNYDADDKYLSDDNMSENPLPIRFQHLRNISSTPKLQHKFNSTNYRTAVESHTLNRSHIDQQVLERIESEIKNLHKRDLTINEFMEQTKNWFEENRRFGNQIMSTIHSDIQNTTDQFKLLKISIDQVKDQIDACRNECKDVGELKKQIAELKKEVNKLKKSSSEQTINEGDLYNLEDEYRTNESTSTFSTQLPFTPSQVIPPLNQRLVPPFHVAPNPYQLYGQSLYNLYNQYSQFAQPTSVAQPIFDPTRPQVNYSGVYPTPDQMYLDVAHLVPPPNVPTAPIVPNIQIGHTLQSTAPTIPVTTTIASVATTTASATPTSHATTKTNIKETREIPRSLPVNVVITSSDPLPTCTTAPAPILSVTIPPKHIKGTPHNYQIQMPSVNESKVITPPIFSFPLQGNKSNITTSTVTSSINWNQATTFTSAQITTPTSINSMNNASPYKNGKNSLEESKTVVDGVSTSPNTSLNKSRTLSERSNTSVENYDPCPDFKPIVPLPAEVKVRTGEEDETVIFASRAKLFRFIDKQWKERGLGEMKLLKHNVTGKVRVLMRREQIHKICANHIISGEMEIKPMKNETKAYFWVANDFADETVVLEKFCIRFKTADIAHDFYTTFEKARQECSTAVTQDNTTGMTSTTTSSSNPLDKVETPIKEKTEFSFMPGKAVVGGFTFSSTPTFKPVIENKAPDTKSLESTPVSKGNVFSSLTFKTTASSAPLNNIFNLSSATAPSSSVVAQTQKEEKTSKLNTSDTVEEFEPTIEFRPVVPLPALVEQKTGEEDEIILFEHRAKLLRLDLSTKEWKERGLGNIKLLVHKENNQKVRLLMRREQIMKVCCNHSVTKDMIFQKMANMDKAVTWCAKDFSEGELVTQTFCLRFKMVQTCNAFVEAIKLAQSKMKDESKAAKEEQNVAKQNNQIGFGDKFKPKEGSWNCQTCYTNNLESYLNCGCCEQPKPQTSTNQIPSVDTTSKKTTTDSAVVSGWGDAFKCKPGSWECKLCFVYNDASVENCIACENPKELESGPKQSTDNTRKFNFSILKKDSCEVNKESTPTPAIFGWGDQFKPKEGTWECKNCFIRNESNTVNCIACKISKDPVSNKTENDTVKFTFGIPASNIQNNGSSTSIFDGTGTHKFKFGIPSTVNDAAVKSSPENVVNQSSSIFTTPKASAENEQPLNFTVKKNDEDNKVDIIPKASLLPTPQTDSHVSFGANENATFSFVFKPKTPIKSKSPMKSPKSPGEESDSNEYAVEDEGHHIHFNPVIPMPEKVEVITGEENEIELYGHRAKLYRFIAGEWKERGIGIVKILKHKETGKLRVVMRREQVLKICLNHAFTPEITYTPKDEKTWLFAANDFSEGELSLQQFCLRFASKEIALEFKKAVDKARDVKPVEGKDEADRYSESKDNNDEKDTPNDDVIFVSEITASVEEKQKAKELMLPENFYTYKNKPPCQGCRGCKEDNGDAKSDLPPNTSTEMITPGTTQLLTTPVKSLTTPFQSPASSMYGTPSNPEKTFDTSIFRTPLSTSGSNSKPTVPATVSFTGSDTNKENTFNQHATIFARSMDQKAGFETQESKPCTLFDAGDSQITNTKTSIIAPPKLNIITTPPKSESTESKAQPEPVKPIFSDAKSLFSNANLSTSSNKSIFDYSNDKKADSANGEVRSIFGEESQKSVNIFGSSTPGSIFGSGAIVGNIMKPSPSIFGSGAGSTFGALVSQNKESDNKSIFCNTEQKLKTNTVDDKKSENNKSLFESGLSYEALSSTATSACFQKKADFQWEGAGQQLFGGIRKSPGDGSGDKAKSETGAGDDTYRTSGADEEYDPHYEPIVPLPDKIVVTTGEEDEQKIFGERCKLFRYDHKTREWKERGVGELKILYHPEKNTYRLLLRREQVLKAVLNMLLFMDLEMFPMKTSDRAWNFVGMNHAETPSGETETLAVRFKSVELANTFHEKVTECIRKLQAAAAASVSESKEATVTPAPLLRLPKHLEDSARADSVISSKSEQPLQSTATVSEPATTTVKTEQNVGSGEKSLLTDYFKQVHFQEPGVEEEHYEDEEDYEHDYDHNDYDAYYNEEEEEDEESAAYYSCDGEATIRQGDIESKCEQARIIVTYDQEIYSPKILVTDALTGEVIADMLIHTDTEFLLSGESCTWSGTDFTSNDSIKKTVSVNFYDSDIAMRFYDSCETSKAATYSSTDPES
ncbi:hypothetical protein O3G_MSEX007721 [Manduca sexta]|uniref:E3 SUMO-protein ligase RanBP2 n=1 Tax=Manduca sexta TaxID=7130 RepID=A0A921Z7Y5_MANSE|nr:hypothetical protein O3G_MSEX007721 [Manduca sexta]KAG6452626.1 hypothetical protein O3G_MSEX007721 [Manduca sexta]